MSNGIGLYRVAGDQLIRMRRAYRHNASWVHVTAVGTLALRAPAVCRADSNGGPWRWTDDDISCNECLRVIRAGLADGSFVMATTAQVTALRSEALNIDVKYRYDEAVRQAARPVRRGERDYDDLSPEWTL
jgi:hypothetical protein